MSSAGGRRNWAPYHQSHLLLRRSVVIVRSYPMHGVGNELLDGQWQFRNFGYINVSVNCKLIKLFETSNRVNWFFINLPSFKAKPRVFTTRYLKYAPLPQNCRRCNAVLCTLPLREVVLIIIKLLLIMLATAWNILFVYLYLIIMISTNHGICWGNSETTSKIILNFKWTINMLVRLVPSSFSWKKVYSILHMVVWKAKCSYLCKRCEVIMWGNREQIWIISPSSLKYPLSENIFRFSSFGSPLIKMLKHTSCIKIPSCTYLALTALPDYSANVHTEAPIPAGGDLKILSGLSLWPGVG